MRRLLCGRCKRSPASLLLSARRKRPRRRATEPANGPNSEPTQVETNPSARLRGSRLLTLRLCLGCRRRSARVARLPFLRKKTALARSGSLKSKPPFLVLFRAGFAGSHRKIRQVVAPKSAALPKKTKGLRPAVFRQSCNITGEEWVYASVAGRSSPVSTRNRPGLPRASLMPIRCRMAFARLPKKLGGWRSS